MSLAALGLGEDATEEQVHQQYRTLAKTAHPDVNNGDATQFHQLQEWRDQALLELRFGQTVSRARSQLHALREAARGTPCPRCDGTGYGMRRTVGFREFKTLCSLCRGRGKL